MTELYTVQIAKWRKCVDLDVVMLDTTVKSGVGFLVPTWDMVIGSKNGTLSNEAYRQQYMEMLQRSYWEHREQWLSLFTHDRLALACYCSHGRFCHRHILRDVLLALADNLNYPVMDCGEII